MDIHEPYEHGHFRPMIWNSQDGMLTRLSSFANRNKMRNNFFKILVAIWPLDLVVCINCRLTAVNADSHWKGENIIDLYNCIVPQGRAKDCFLSKP